MPDIRIRDVRNANVRRSLTYGVWTSTSSVESLAQQCLTFVECRRVRARTHQSTDLILPRSTRSTQRGNVGWGGNRPTNTLPPVAKTFIIALVGRARLAPPYGSLHPSHFPLHPSVLPALKGPNIVAQGIALGTGWPKIVIRPERATQACFAPSGRSVEWSLPHPGRCPRCYTQVKGPFWTSGPNSCQQVAKSCMR